MSPYSEYLRARFNKRLGSRSRVAKEANKPKSEQSKRVTRPEHIKQNAGRAVRQRISTGAQRLPPELRKTYIRQFGRSAVGGVSSPASSFQKTLENIVDETLKEIDQRQDTERAIQLAMENPAATSDEDDGIFKKIAEAVMTNTPLAPLMTGDVKSGTPIGNAIVAAENVVEGGQQEEPQSHWQGLMEDFSRSPVGRGLDIVSRPAYGAFEGMQNALEADYATRGTPEEQTNPLRYLDELGGGFWQGLSGQEKTGFGDVWHTMREDSDIVGMEKLRELDETNPGATRWLDRAVGLGGEITMDPLNWVSGGATGIIRNTGAQLTETSAKAAIRESVNNIARDFFDDVISTTGGLRYKPSQDAIAAYATQAAEDAITKNLLEISSGTHAGWGKMGLEGTAQSTANRVTQTVRDEFFKSFDNRVEKVIVALNQGGNLPPNAWRTHLSQSPELSDTIDNMMNDINAAAVAKGLPAPYRSRAMFTLSLGKNDIPKLQRYINQTKDTFDAPLAQHVFDEVYKNTRQFYYNTIGIRLGRKTIPIKTFGKAYTYTKENLPQRAKLTAENFAESMSFERNAPGRISLMAQNGRSIGAQSFEKFHTDWSKLARGFSKQEDHDIFLYLNDMVSAVPPKLENMTLLMRDELKKMFSDEMASGARPENAVAADNYAFIYNRGGKQKDRETFKRERKKTIKATGSALGWNLERARSMNLRPVESAFDSLIRRKMKSMRDITRALFMKDLIDNFGVMSKGPLSTAAMRTRSNLEEIPVGNLPQQFRTEFHKGNRFYLPREHKRMYDTYAELSAWNSADARMLLREFSRATNFIKYLSTVPRPGFHIRNFIGDIFMGILDHIPSKTYSEVLNKYTQHLAGKTVNFKITSTMAKSWDEMKSLYDLHANSGFIETEIPLGGSSPSAGQHVSNLRKRTANKARQFSDVREDYGRFVHFVGAFRQEANALLRKGHKGARLEEKALEAAVWRVNHYKFDYSALTALERKIKLVFPFYTFTRKAAPTLMQQLYLNPKWMAIPNRFMEYNDGSAADNFNAYHIPDYIRDMGYGMLTDEDEPKLITGDILPSASVLNSLDFTNSQQFAQSAMSQTNPMLQLGAETALGREFFSGRPTGSFPEYVANKFSFPGQFVRQASGPDNEPAWIQALNETWFGAGVPVRQLSEESQDFAFRELEDRFIQDPFSEINRSQELFRVYQSSNGVFKVKNNATGAILFETQNPSEAVAYVKQVIG